MATTDPNGDRTSSAHSGSALAFYRAGKLLRVRFELEESDFGPWEPALAANGWTDEQIALLRTTAAHMGERNLTKWRARRTPLPLPSVRAIAAKSYTSKWREVSADDLASVRATRSGDVDELKMNLIGYHVVSRREPYEDSFKFSFQIWRLR